jgi:hypothetical protein
MTRGPCARECYMINVYVGFINQMHDARRDDARLVSALHLIELEVYIATFSVTNS